VRITHISDCYLPRLGGIEVQVAELTRRQAAAGDRVDVITATPGDTVKSGTEDIDGVAVHRVTARLPFELPVRPRTRAAVAPLLRRLRPDVVHVHVGVVSPFAWGGIRAAVEVGVPVLATVHSVWGAAARTGYGTSEALLHWYRSGLQPAAVSRVAAERIAATLPDGAVVLITPNGVDPQQWSPSGRVDRGPDAPMTFAAAMRLAPRKRAAALLDMFAAAQAACVGGRTLRLVIAGDGPHRARLEAAVRDRGMADAVTFLGRLTRPDLRELYLASDAFVQSSVKESFGLAALEARTTGLPIIARSQTGLTEFVTDGVEGLLADDDAAMGRAMARLALDRQLFVRITEHNTHRLPDQVWPQVLQDLAGSYRTAQGRAAR
jgi:glycosyltransferase involved in cell wall biosynthesis